MSPGLIPALLRRLRRSPDDSSAPSGRRRDTERGSALIISLMIMIILTMIGVTFLVLSEQEERISVNSRDYSQTLYVAEAGVELAKTWFNDPSVGNLLKPTSAQMGYRLRKGRTLGGTWHDSDELAAGVTDTDATVDGSAGNIYTGGNLNGTGASRFDKPYRGDPGYGFWGRQNTPDVLICNNATLDVDGDGTADCTASMTTYLNNVSDTLGMSTPLRTDGHNSRDWGSVSLEQIRVYRPPIDFDLDTRFGIATIESTAVKRVKGQIVARRTVREVIQEIPFPGPGGAIETDGSLGMGGSTGVHWGPIQSSSVSGNITYPNGANFPGSTVPRTSAQRFGYHWSINPATGRTVGAAVPPATATVTFLTDTFGGANAPEDPWFVAKARNYNDVGNPGAAQPYPYTVVPNQRAKSEFFNYQIVRFPPIDYDTWKQVAQSPGKGNYYFKWVAGSTFQRNGVGPTQDFATWLGQFNSTGVFFFDTKDSKKPLVDLSNLTPQLSWAPGLYVQGFIYCNAVSCSSSGSGGNTTVPCNAPGEPFLDDGIDLHPPGVTTGDDCICLRYDSHDGCVLGTRPIGYGGGGAQGQAWPAANYYEGTASQCPNTLTPNTTPGSLYYMNNVQAGGLANAAKEAAAFRNGTWDSDIDNDGVTDAASDITTLTGWSRFISANTGLGQGFTGGHSYAAGILPGYPAALATKGGQNAGIGANPQAYDWKRDPRFLNHLADLSYVNADRQPYEPYVNLDGPTVGNTPGSWRPWPVNFQTSGEVIERNSGGAAIRSTTVARDADGPLCNLDLDLNGIWYNEGTYSGHGNMKIYGSMLMKGAYDMTGSIDVWFNEGLVKGKFPPASWKLPRIFASGRDTN